MYNLRIVIPPHPTTEILNMHLKVIKNKLVYLETPHCRISIPESERVRKIQEATEEFRAILREKEIVLS
jgi:hypothetical protein